MTRIHSLGVALLLTVSASVVPPADSRPIERFQARSIDRTTNRSFPIDIAIERWWTNSEREMLARTLRDEGPEKTADVLMRIHPRAGSWRAPFWPEGLVKDVDIVYAADDPAPEGGRDVVLATRSNKTSPNGTSSQYLVTVIEIHLDKYDRGEGKMVPAARIRWDAKANRIDIGNDSTLPVELFKVTATKG